jgi:hypothetical protein
VKWGIDDLRFQIDWEIDDFRLTIAERPGWAIDSAGRRTRCPRHVGGQDAFNRSINNLQSSINPKSQIVNPSIQATVL